MLTLLLEFLRRGLIKADFDVEEGVPDGGIVADQGPGLVTVDHGDDVVGQDVGWRSFLM